MPGIDLRVYLRLIRGQGEQAVDLDELAAWKLLQILLAEWVYQGPIQTVEPNFRCLAAGCTNRATESTGFSGYCAIRKSLSEGEQLAPDRPGATAPPLSPAIDRSRVAWL
ncbi:hypothetical protein KDA_75510 [Dictyobacter alpinus]|uniref:Uncharacterized protein n=1 Tax=Dictyobacter alpinus TaxID=2014873 RepID=A0A402BL26_9CHLR|nr:hypothetical protein [Dictyobacter alpinus]GCE32067.1 hypothetical protein KDA_75510 [Dictyobacter alpinus]